MTPHAAPLRSFQPRSSRVSASSSSSPRLHTTSPFALSIAAPSLAHDRDAPWTGAPGAHGEAGLAAMFWLSFHGLSAFIHAVFVTVSVAGPMLLAIVPVPFLVAMCSDVKPVEKPIERVEMAIVEIPPPPPEPPPPPVDIGSDDTLAVKEIAKVSEVKVSKKQLKKQAALRDAAEFGMIGLLSSSQPSDQLSALLAVEQVNGVEGGVVGGVAEGNMWGDSIGDSFGAGGLGLSGVGEGGGGRGEGIGLGTIGTIGRGSGGGSGGGVGTGFGSGQGYGVAGRTKYKIKVTLPELAQGSRARLERMLVACRIEETISGTVTVVDDAVASVSMTPNNACAARTLQRMMFDADGTFTVTISPVAP